MVSNEIGFIRKYLAKNKKRLGIQATLSLSLVRAISFVNSLSCENCQHIYYFCGDNNEKNYYTKLMKFVFKTQRQYEFFK